MCRHRAIFFPYRLMTEIPMMRHHLMENVSKIIRENTSVLMHYCFQVCCNINQENRIEMKNNFSCISHSCSTWSVTHFQRGCLVTFHRISVNILWNFTKEVSIMFHLPPLYLVRFHNFYNIVFEYLDLITSVSKVSSEFFILFWTPIMGLCLLSGYTCWVGRVLKKSKGGSKSTQRGPGCLRQSPQP